MATIGKKVNFSETTDNNQAQKKNGMRKRTVY